LTNNIRNQASACAIGSVTFTELVYYGYRPVGSGPGGAAVSPRYVANTILPVGVTLHHLCYEVEVALDADEAAALYTSNIIPVPGTSVSPLTVTEKGTVGGVEKTRTITFNSSYFQDTDKLKVEAEAEHQLVVIRFLCLAVPSFGAWA
jgi:hypothetical protein